MQKTLEQGWLRLVSPKQMGTLFKVMAFTPQPCTLAGLHK
jgi:SAM-dependent MidA family methyltransferase